MPSPEAGNRSERAIARPRFCRRERHSAAPEVSPTRIALASAVGGRMTRESGIRRPTRVWSRCGLLKGLCLGPVPILFRWRRLRH